jgi:hypothetical protein
VTTGEGMQGTTMDASAFARVTLWTMMPLPGLPIRSVVIVEYFDAPLATKWRMLVDSVRGLTREV